MNRFKNRLLPHLGGVAPVPPATPSGGIVEIYKPQQPRILFFHFLTGVMLLVLASGLAYRQVFRSGEYGERERLQNQRRVLVPGPRGNIYDRNGRLLVGNRPRFAVTLYLDELRQEFRAEYIKVVRRYREGVESGIITPEERPSSEHLEQIARAQVVQRYLDRVNRLLDCNEKVDVRDLDRHFQQQLLLPYILLDDLKPEEYARLVEQLPVESPLQVYTSSTRYYPYGPAAAHVLGYVGTRNMIPSEALPGDDLRTYAFKGTFGRDGLELRFDSRLEGETGGIIFRVDPAGFRVNPPLYKHMPVQGHNLSVSIDIDLQIAAEEAMAEYTDVKGAAVALDARTGEVLVLASKPGYNLKDFSPRLSRTTVEDINERGAWIDRAIQGTYPPGSTFKLITSLAGLRCGRITPESKVVCTGRFQVGSRTFACNNHRDRGEIDFRNAIRASCNTFFYKHGIDTGAENIAAEARRMHLDEPTGIELPHETHRMLVPDPRWMKQAKNETWLTGNTANYAIGQGDVAVTPLQMACLVASLARGETLTRPTLIHEAGRAAQHAPSIDLPKPYWDALIQGMEMCIQLGTGRLAAIPGVRIAGKTGTAQAPGSIDIAWFVAFAPIENPEIALAVMIEGNQPDEAMAGGRFAAPVGKAIFLKYFERRNRLLPQRVAAN